MMYVLDEIRADGFSEGRVMLKDLGADLSMPPMDCFYRAIAVGRSDQGQFKPPSSPNRYIYKLTFTSVGEGKVARIYVVLDDAGTGFSCWSEVVIDAFRLLKQADISNTRINFERRPVAEVLGVTGFLARKQAELFGASA